MSTTPEQCFGIEGLVGLRVESYLARKKNLKVFVTNFNYRIKLVFRNGKFGILKDSHSENSKMIAI